MNDTWNSNWQIEKSIAEELVFPKIETLLKLIMIDFFALIFDELRVEEPLRYSDELTLVLIPLNNKLQYLISFLILFQSNPWY